MQKISVEPVKLKWAYGGGNAVATPFNTSCMCYKLEAEAPIVGLGTLYRPYFIYFDMEGENCIQLSDCDVSEHIGVMYCQQHFNEMIDSVIEIKLT